MRLNTIKPAAGSKHAKRRVGRGIGSGLGLPIAASVTQFLFASLPFSASLASCLVGLLVYGVSTSFWLVVDTDIDITPNNNTSSTTDVQENKFMLDPFVDTTVSREKQDQLRSQAHSAQSIIDTDDAAEGVKSGLF